MTCPVLGFQRVGLAGFEPTTFRPPDGRATKLRYSPMSFACEAPEESTTR